MLEIIKYQLRGRKGAILLLLGIFGVLNAVAYLVEIYASIKGIGDFHSLSPLFVFWLVLACATPFLVTFAMFFLCGSGHINELLFRNTSYQMLTVPRHGWEILGGRLIAGLIEFLAYFLATGFLASVHVAILAPIGAKDAISPLQAFGFMYEQVFIVNFAAVAQIALIGVMIFAIVGTFITFAVIASRCFVKRKGLAMAAAIAIFVFVSSVATQWGTEISERFHWYWRLTLNFRPDSSVFFRPSELYMAMPQSASGQLPIASLLFFLAFAVALFAASSWLMEKKVEL
jgi:hypothetical protein